MHVWIQTYTRIQLFFYPSRFSAIGRWWCKNKLLWRIKRWVRFGFPTDTTKLTEISHCFELIWTKIPKKRKNNFPPKQRKPTYPSNSLTPSLKVFELNLKRKFSHRSLSKPLQTHHFMWCRELEREEEEEEEEEEESYGSLSLSLSQCWGQKRANGWSIRDNQVTICKREEHRVMMMMKKP